LGRKGEDVTVNELEQRKTYTNAPEGDEDKDTTFEWCRSGEGSLWGTNYFERLGEKRQEHA